MGARVSVWGWGNPSLNPCCLFTRGSLGVGLGGWGSQTQQQKPAAFQLFQAALYYAAHRLHALVLAASQQWVVGRRDSRSAPRVDQPGPLTQACVSPASHLWAAYRKAESSSSTQPRSLLALSGEYRCGTEAYCHLLKACGRNASWGGGTCFINLQQEPVAKVSLQALTQLETALKGPIWPSAEGVS